VKFPRVKNILFSQNPPADFDSSPYAEIIKNYNIRIDFYKFFQMHGIPYEEFSKNKISFLDYNAIIMTNKNAIDHFFRIVEEMKIKMPVLSTKYFCSNAVTANYLQKYTKCKKRKVFFPQDGDPEKLVTEILRHADDKFLLPSAIDTSLNLLTKLLDKQKINYDKAEVFKISFADVSKAIDIYAYDMVVFFSPYGIQTLMNSYPEFKQGKMIIGALGSRVIAAAQDAGLNVQIKAPTEKHPSIFSAIDHYLFHANGRKRYNK
jgi:uroporphyrinogen-III synthase